MLPTHAHFRADTILSMPAEHKSSVAAEPSSLKEDGVTGCEPLFVRACKRKAVDRTPIWLMRQAGRFMPEYRAIREKVSFLELCKTSQLAAEVTVMAVEQLKVDAAIIFADILLPLEPLGVGLHFAKGDGPVIERPIRSHGDVLNLNRFDVDSELGFVYESIKIVVKALGDRTPLIGFAGAPFTLASYMIEGGSSRQFDKTKTFMYTQAAAWHGLMEVLSEVTSRYLNGQIKAGAKVVQLFDSWVGCLSPSDYNKFVAPHMKSTIAGIADGVPVIHFGTGTSTLLETMRNCGGDVIGLDWRVELDEAWKRVGHDVAVQGNLDPVVLLADRGQIREQAQRILDQANNRPGHIFNLGHGILPTTPVDNVKYLVEIVGEISTKNDQRSAKP